MRRRISLKGLAVAVFFAAFVAGMSWYYLDTYAVDWHIKQYTKGISLVGDTYNWCKRALASLKLYNVKMHYIPADSVSGKMPEIRFVDDGKTLLVIKAERGNLRFMREFDTDLFDNKRWLALSDSFPGGKNFNYRKNLLDLHGRGNCRYLIIADIHPDSSKRGNIGYLIDTEENFKIVGKIDIKNKIEVVYFNKELIFPQEILYFGNFGTDEEIAVVLPVRYGRNGEPEFLKGINEGMCTCAFDISFNRGMEKKATSLLYARMLQIGTFKNAKEAAAHFGYSKEFIEQTHSEAVQKIKDSPYKKIIEKRNDIDVDKM